MYRENFFTRIPCGFILEKHMVKVYWTFVLEDLKLYNTPIESINFCV